MGKTKTDENRSTKISIPDHTDPHIQQAVQYGVVWPDGTHTWQQIDRGLSMTPIAIAMLIPGADLTGVTDTQRQWSLKYWMEMIQGRAEGAMLPVDDYRELHHFIKRTVILSVTGIEEL